MAFGGVKLTLYVNKPDKKFYGLRQISSKTGSRWCLTLPIIRTRLMLFRCLSIHPIA